MRWLQTEYILKGVFLGLMLYAALYEAETPPTAVAPTDEQTERGYPQQQTLNRIGTTSPLQPVGAGWVCCSPWWSRPASSCAKVSVCAANGTYSFFSCCWKAPALVYLGVLAGAVVGLL